LWAWLSDVRLVVEGEAILVPAREGRVVEAAVSGQLTEIAVEEGASIAAGALLLRLHAPQVVRELAEARKAEAALALREEEAAVGLPERLALVDRKLAALQVERNAIARVTSSTEHTVAAEEEAVTIARQQHENRPTGLAREHSRQQAEQRATDAADAFGWTALAQRAQELPHGTALQQGFDEPFD